MIYWATITAAWTAHMLVYFGYCFEKEATRLELAYSLAYYANTLALMCLGDAVYDWYYDIPATASPFDTPVP